MSGELWRDKRPHPTSMARDIYRLPHEVPFDRFDPETGDYVHAGTTPWVVVSWGRDGDTQIFPSSDEGRILDMSGLVRFGLWNWWVPRDEALTMYLTDESVRNGFVQHAQGDACIACDHTYV